MPLIAACTLRFARMRSARLRPASSISLRIPVGAPSSAPASKPGSATSASLGANLLSICRSAGLAIKRPLSSGWAKRANSAPAFAWSSPCNRIARPISEAIGASGFSATIRSSTVAGSLSRSSRSWTCAGLMRSRVAMSPASIPASLSVCTVRACSRMLSSAREKLDAAPASRIEARNFESRMSPSMRITGTSASGPSAFAAAASRWWPSRTM